MVKKGMYKSLNRQEGKKRIGFETQRTEDGDYENKEI